MKKSSIDVYIYDTSKELHKSAPEITGKLNELAGVINVSVNSKVGDLLVVNYEPSRITAMKILSVLRSNGCSGSLVGM